MSNKLPNADNNNFSELLLSQVLPGQKCIIKQIFATSSTTLRLAELGLTADTVVKVIRLAPMGDPLELSLRGYFLCIRKATAKQIMVIKTKQL